MSENLNPDDFIITRKRKLYKFALFANSPFCFELEEWSKRSDISVLEIGAGTGLFSVALAALKPDVRVIAVDVKGDRLQKGAGEAERQSLSNVSFIRARADQLAELVEDHSLDSLWITFPDPFPRERSERRRLTHPVYLAVYKQLLSAGGSLYFKTDASPLFTWTLEQLVREGWRIKELSFDLHESNLLTEYKLMTSYETRFMDEGLPIRFVRARPPLSDD